MNLGHAAFSRQGRFQNLWVSFLTFREGKSMSKEKKKSELGQERWEKWEKVIALPAADLGLISGKEIAL